MMLRSVLTALTLLAWTAFASAAERPNIVFFFTDDQAYDTLGVYGNPDVETPHIDSLGKRGVVFDRHYDTTAICMASRANVMTGLYEYKAGCNFDHGPLGTKQWSTSYPRLLKRAGYRIGFGGKFGFAVSDSKKGRLREGDRVKDEFDFWAGGPGQTSYVTKANPTLAKYAKDYPHSTRAYAAATIDFMRQSVENKQPFAMSVFFKAPHRPVQPDPLFDDVYAETTFRKLPNYGRKAGEHFAPHSRLGRQYPRFVEWGYHTDETYQQALRKYHQLIHGVDVAVGMVLAELENLGIADATVIVFSSDNGYFNGSHGLGSKVLPYEEGARVPLIVYDPRYPKIGKPRRSSSLTGNVDIAATILDLAGVPVPDVYDGRSLLPIVRDSEASVRETLPIVQCWGPEPTRCLSVLNGRLKYVYWYYEDEKRDLEPTEELYDLVADPYELTNVAGDPRYATQLAASRRRYDEYVAHWRRDGVTYNGYGAYGTLFDRNVPWSEKAPLLKKTR